jgi:phosphatidylglycerol:prolipoprotein diacylglycerol transferase
MYPVILSIGSITIFSLWIFISIGFFAALLIMNKLIQKSRLQLKFISNHSLAIFFAGLIVSRFFYIIKFYDIYFYEFSGESLVRVLYIWDKGLSPWGGIIGIGLGLLYFAWKEKENIPKWFDVFSVSLLGAMIFTNIGAFLDGINYGRETSLPWGVTIESSMYAVPIHPTQLYAATYCLLLTGLLFSIFNQKITKEPGTISIIALGGYSFFKVLEEFLRGDESTKFFEIREMQIYAFIGLLVAISIFLFKKLKKSKHGNI